MEKVKPEAIVLTVDPSPLMHLQRKTAFQYYGAKTLPENRLHLPYPLFLAETVLDFTKMDGFAAASQGTSWTIQKCSLPFSDE